MGCGGSVVQQDQMKVVPQEKVDNKSTVVNNKDAKVNSATQDKGNKTQEQNLHNSSIGKNQSKKQGNNSQILNKNKAGSTNNLKTSNIKMTESVDIPSARSQSKGKNELR